ncbi:hypothetical protein K505DRAFT_323622 [Melanomma pulvis-pyrius CBS 109.77]|uniref:Uncharacterized protein n=1 Tax=Melanomma pulvis-pyrius CBS 109.77 TaxID=1314802 RepID=A0A6A6XI03_9PLEO|nr:hypothetical protein K505DRAFT_323622 [Melanomma pulvis-pyrius CBS 109.77]
MLPEYSFNTDRAAGFHGRDPQPKRNPVGESKTANANLYDEWQHTAERYLALYKSTQNFVSTVHELSQLPHCFQQATTMLVEFSSGVLRTSGSCFPRMLNSQRASIYTLLDTALLHILLREWEKGELGEKTEAWDVQTKPLCSALESRVRLFPEWALEDYAGFLAGESNGEWMTAIYFYKSRRFLEESLQVYGLRKRVDMVVRGRLPAELVDEIVRHVSLDEDVPTESLGKRHSLKGKQPV